MSALYQIVAEYRDAADKLADSGLDAQTIADTLEGMGADVDEKAIAVASVIRNLEAERDAVRAAVIGMVERAKALDTRAERLRDYLRSNLDACEIKRISCPLFVIAIKANPPRVLIDDASLLPPSLLTTPEPPPPQPDKMAIKAALRAGPVPGARLENSTRLEIR